MSQDWRVPWVGFFWTALMALNPAMAASGDDQEIVADVIMSRNDDGISACGIGFKLVRLKQTYSVNIVIEKAGTTTVTKVIATPEKGQKLKSASIRTAEFSTSDILTNSVSKRDGLLYAKSLTPGENARLFQQLMVSGAEIAVKTDDETHTWRLPGPASQSLRAMYLMCSGDMFRP